ncbi:hypothetical protein PoB_006423800 [Plakobranchus ocellatus]|uniref:Uncharacterized protein n=1 Tax=Plakobranchus ocellatus TaxID=259542 RepID=A0AAV4D113_9GAST|nr:hypothetical protein PoB_006423800 [Plakobranchus ocellatus]
MLPYSQYAARHFDACQHPPCFPTVSILPDILMHVNILHASLQSVCCPSFRCLSASSMLPYTQYAARHFDACQYPPCFSTASMLPYILMLVNILHASLQSVCCPTF